MFRSYISKQKTDLAIRSRGIRRPENQTSKSARIVRERLPILDFLKVSNFLEQEI